MSEGYSLEKWRTAPETTLSPEDQEFLETYDANNEEIKRRLGENSALLRILRVAFSPTAFRVAVTGDLADALKDRELHGSKDGQMQLAHEEAEAMNARYEQLKTEADAANQRFLDYVDELNGRASSSEEA